MCTYARTRTQTHGGGWKEKERGVSGGRWKGGYRSKWRTGGVPGVVLPGGGQRFGRDTSKGRQVQDGHLLVGPNIAHNKIIRLDNICTHLRSWRLSVSTSFMMLKKKTSHHIHTSQTYPLCVTEKRWQKVTELTSWYLRQRTNKNLKVSLLDKNKCQQSKIWNLQNVQGSKKQRGSSPEATGHKWSSNINASVVKSCHQRNYSVLFLWMPTAPLLAPLSTVAYCNY